jgi:Bacterial extracellular solute-binding proteins, family 3
MGATEERLKVLDVINYFQNGTGVAVPRGNPQKLNVHDLCGCRVGVQSGSTSEVKWLPQLTEKVGLPVARRCPRLACVDRDQRGQRSGQQRRGMGRCRRADRRRWCRHDRCSPPAVLAVRT